MPNHTYHKDMNNISGYIFGYKSTGEKGTDHYRSGLKKFAIMANFFCGKYATKIY